MPWPFLHQQKLPEGAQELERALAIDPRHADARYNLGVGLLELDRPEEALSRLRQAREKGSKQTDIAFNLVRAELAANRTEEARQEAENAAKIFGADSAWRRAVGQLFLQYKQPREAALHLAEAARLEPGSEEIRRQLAAAHLDAGDAASALPLLENAAGAEDHYLAASAYLLLHRLAEADRESSLALEKEPAVRYQSDLTQAYYQLSRVYAQLGRKEESERALAIFNELKKQEADLDSEFAEDVRKELQPADQK